MIRIGFIDHFLDEWHANNYPGWIADPRHGGRFQVTHAWAEKDKPGGLTTAQWCAKFGVEQASSPEELIEACDAVVVLSPDNPERHEALSAPALKSGKPVYVDKTFAPTAAATRRMFELARSRGTPMYSTSALRYAQELGWIRDMGYTQGDVVFASARGPGAFANYSIHQLEMIVAAMGPGAVRAVATGAKAAPVVAFEYADGRAAVVNHLPWAGFSLALQCADGAGAVLNVEANFWEGFTDALLKFFETGKPPVPEAETVAAIEMVEAGMKALDAPGTWINI